MKKKTDRRQAGFSWLSAAELMIGCFLYALSISVFYSPAKLLGGGVTGIAQILEFQFGLPVSAMVLAINVPLFVVAFILLDRRFVFGSLIGMGLLALFLYLTGGMRLEFSSRLTPVVVGGVMNGFGIGLVYRSDASVGGTDIIAKIVQRYFSGNMAYTALACNVVIVGVSAFIYGLDQAVLTVCAMYISSQVNSYLIDGMDHRRAVTVITRDPEKMVASIFAGVNRGATVLKGYGGYSHEEHDMVYCVINRRELSRLKHSIKSADPDAFFTITRVTGVYGNGKSFHSVQRDIP